MDGRFDVTFPLVLDWDGCFSITFTLQRGRQMAFTRGIYYLEGDNGSGKSTFISMLSLTAGAIGNHAATGPGTVVFNGTAYNEKGFDHIRAAEIRETFFCVFPQKAFFLPVSVRDNYLVLNGSDPKKAAGFSDRQNPDFLSGGQQQKILMDIALDEKRPVWFLDEPLANLDAERRHYFWKTLKTARGKGLGTIFLIDHWMGEKIRQHRDFERFNGLRVFIENRKGGGGPEIEFKKINIYANPVPDEFLDDQIRKTQGDRARNKTPDALRLEGDWGAGTRR